MTHWTLSPGGAGCDVPVEKVVRLVSAIGASNRTLLASAVLNTLHGWVATHHCSILCFEGERSPRLLSGASLQHQWHVFNIASVYARDFYRKDALHQLIDRYPASFEAPPVLVHRQQVSDIEDAEYRAQCYDCIGIIDRVSVLIRVGRSQSLAVNLYRDQASGPFSDDDVARLIGLAPLFASCVQRHYGLDTDGETSFRGAVTDELAELCPQLTLREREVLQRILDGVTTERIAEDLHIRPTTVITYRTRGYEKLGVSSRRELFAAVLRKRTGAEEPGPGDEQMQAA